MYPARVAYSTLFFALLMALAFAAKPGFAFDPDGGVRPFGVEPGQTLFPLGVLTVVAAVGSLFLFGVVDMACGV